MKHILRVLLFFCCTISLAQTVIEMPSSSFSRREKYIGCSTDVIFTDDGGRTGSYADSASGEITFCPVIGTDRMVFNFTFMNLAVGDVLTVYDGDSTAAPLINTFTNTLTAPGIVQATVSNTTGCLTFRFISNVAVSAAGWEATRSCIDPCQTITPVITTFPAVDTDGILRVCAGDNIQFEGDAIFSASNAGATYQWDFDNGRGLNPGRNQTEVFTRPGSYQVRFQVTDANGCSDRNLIDLVVQVSTEPDFTGTLAVENEICIGESTTLTGAVATVPFRATPAPPVTGQTFLPDGNGVSYQTCIDVDLFDAGAVFTDPSNLLNMFMNIEHSWADDLDIILTAPNGSSIVILQAGEAEGQKFLGMPVQDDVSPTAPGQGFRYEITEMPPANETFQRALSLFSVRVPFPAGSYRPQTSFSNFVGSSLNGQWCLTVTDNAGRDNGYIFQWGLNFNPALVPTNLSYQPAKVREEWLPDMTILARNGNDITVQPDAVGTKCYTYEVEDDFGCIYTEEVCIEVRPLPAPLPPVDLIVCDNVGNINSVDLTQNTASMLADQNATDFRVSYYRQLADAQNDTNLIANPANYSAGTTPETIYASVINNATGCSTIRNFQVAIQRAIHNDVPDLTTCDDASNDGFEVFDLTQTTPAILGTQSSTDATVTYYRTQAEANVGLNPITNLTAYTNENTPIQTIFTRVESVLDATCFDSGTFNVVVGGNPVVANTIPDFEICDDDSNDGLANFVLSSNDAAVLGGQDPAAFEVTYYNSQIEANMRQNSILKTGFQNSVNPQTFFARIDSRFNTDCFATTSFNLVVNEKPILGLPIDLENCDDPSGDGVEVFLLTDNDTNLLNGSPAADYRITYHLNQTDANTATAAVAPSFTSSSPAVTIFARVENINTGCFSIASFQLIIKPVPLISAVPILQVCDVNNDGTTVFRLNDRTAAISTGQSGVSVSYFNTQANALAGTSSLDPEAYTGNSPNETIFYRIQFDATGCFTTGSFDLEIVPPPVTQMPVDVALCDDGSGNISYDLNNSSAQIQNGQTDTRVSYYDSQIAANAGTNPIATLITYTADRIVFARLENTVTSCFDMTVLNLLFGEIPLPQLQDEVVLCRDPQGMLVDGPAVLDTGLSNVDFDFEWRFDGQLLPTETDSVLITEQQGLYEVIVTNAATGCTNSDSTRVRLAGPPDTFTIDITSEPFQENQRVEITANGPDNYWFQLDDGLYQDNPVFDNVTPGIHTITIAERNGCGAVTSQIFVYGYPKFFTPNNDGFNDTWNVAADDSLPNLRIFIFDRYGKLLKQLNPTGAGWDGIFNGELLPSTDYWFRLEYELDGSSREVTGHFSLKR